MNCSLPISSIHRVLQRRILEWIAMRSSSESSRPRDLTWVSCIAGRFFTTKPLGKTWYVFKKSLSHVQLFATPWTAPCKASLSITNSRNLLKLMSIESMMPSNHPCSVVPFFSFNLFHPLGLFQWVSSLHQMAKILEFQFQLQHQSIQRLFRTDSCRIGQFDLLAVQGTVKSPPTPHFKSLHSLFSLQEFL